MFSLQNQRAKLINLNPRAELHGEDKHLACDLKFEIKVSNDVLSEFHPSLKSALYKKESDAAQGELIDDPSHLSGLRFPELGPIKWGWEGAGYEVTMHIGVSGKGNAFLLDCEVDSFRFACQEGGTVVVSFRVIAHPDAADLGRMCELIQQEVEITLTPPSADDLLRKQMKEMEEEEAA
ncbi:hypothetical protein J5J83_19890 [Azoarcus sp. L1K30]|uniref:hypothetical protein n=1 Tax=Azoarcus sp. L1K30 TaxID=2820277 RepID=UPI001B82E1CA|nr:hypothetical protein [Azoarcus sp. L1K30]MBR0568390.1 hypothetical protein [Azoarcus sp. L1K30]